VTRLSTFEECFPRAPLYRAFRAGAQKELLILIISAILAKRIDLASTSNMQYLCKCFDYGAFWFYRAPLNRNLGQFLEEDVFSSVLGVHLSRRPQVIQLDNEVVDEVFELLLC